MSREFGESLGSFFHWKISACIDDLKTEANMGFHKEMVPMFENLYEIAYWIASAEACDSDEKESKKAFLEHGPMIVSEINRLMELAKKD